MFCQILVERVQVFSGDTFFCRELRDSLFLIFHHGDEIVMQMRRGFVHMNGCGYYIFFPVSGIQKLVALIKKQGQFFLCQRFRCGNHPIAHYVYVRSFQNLDLAHSLVQEIQAGEGLIFFCKVVIQVCSAFVNIACTA